ncbi:MAG TPA: hypothetical protein VLR26_10100 [Frankiaceae bacterium]|nr:hypothetical protein [Frankiaceae bacterium]
MTTASGPQIIARDILAQQVAVALGGKVSRFDEISAHISRFDADTWVTVDVLTGAGGSMAINLIPADNVVAIAAAVASVKDG